MPSSPLQIEFLGDVLTIDFNHTTPLEVSSKSDFDFFSSSNRMDLGKPLPPVPFQRQSTPKRYALQDIAHLMSINRSERRPSESSCPSMTTDSFSSRTSDTSLDDRYSDCTSPDGWDSYWTTTKDARPPSCYLDLATKSQPRTRLSNENRCYGSPNPSTPKSTPKSKGKIYQSESNRSSPNLPMPRKKQSQTILRIPPPPPIPQSYVSWSGEPANAPTRPNRPRANTTPTRPPSNLSTCTTLNVRNLSSDSSPMYMKIPITPPYNRTTFTALPPLDQENETSYFEFDDEEESARAKLAKVFRRRASANTTGTTTPERNLDGSLTDRPKRKFRKRVSDANQTIKGVFGIKN